MTFRGIQVFDVFPHFDSIEAGQLDDLSFAAGSFGIATPWRPTSGIKRTVTLPVALQGLAEIGDLREFFDAHRGRQKPFWLPSWVNDFVLMADAVATDTEITVEAHGFSEKFALGNQFKFIALVTRAGKLECYGVTAVDDTGADDVLTLSRGLDTDLVADDTVCCPLLIARASEDDLDYEYLSGDVISGTIGFTELTQEYPAPEESSSALDSAHFGTRPVYLYRITDGVTTLRYADYGVDVTAASLVWTAADLSHDPLESSWDMLGDAVNITLRTDDPDHPLRVYLNDYNLANFSAEIFEADMDDLGALDLAEPDHIGRIEAVEFGDQGEIKLEVSSLFRLNEREIPAMRMQRTCNWRTFQGGCGAVQATFTTAGTITAIEDDPAFVEATEFGAKATAESDPNWFALGMVTVGTERRLCTGQDGDRLYLNLPFVSAAVSDAVSAVAGDDKRVGTCNTKFGQLANHSGAFALPNENPQIEPLKTPAATGGKK